MIIESRAPLRVDFGGGTLDIPFFAEREGGVTLNCAVARYGYASFYKGGKDLVLKSLDYNKSIRIKRPIKYDGKLDLLKAGIKMTDFSANGRIVTKCDFPPHSRLGSSSAVAVAFLGLIHAVQGKRVNKIRIADLAASLEADELKLCNGKQDQYASALGGINLLRFDSSKKVKLKKVRLKKDIIEELERRLFLCYQGVSIVSGNLNGRIIGKYLDGDKKVVDALRNIKTITLEMHKNLVKGRLDEFAELLNEETFNRAKLDPAIVDKKTKRTIKLGLENGASAAKVLGAGGGGCVLFYSKEDKERELKKAIERKGMNLFDFKFDFEGLKTWRLGKAL